MRNRAAGRLKGDPGQLPTRRHPAKKSELARPDVPVPRELGHLLRKVTGRTSAPLLSATPEEDGSRVSKHDPKNQEPTLRQKMV